MTVIDDSRWKSDVNALKGYEDVSTTSAMGKIAQDANGGKTTPLIHANDKSYDELVDEYKGLKSNGAEVVELAAHIADGLEIVGLVESSGPAAPIALPVIALFAGAKKLVEANQRGAELETARQRDEQHVAMLTNLALPAEFKNEAVAKYSHVGKTFESANQKMTSQLAGQDHALMALVQLHCDQGMNAAREPGAMSANAAKRYAEDPAFKAGYDAMKWAQSRGGDTLGAVTRELESRDVRYGAAGVSWRA